MLTATQTQIAVVKTAPGVGNVALVEVPEPECTAQGVKIAVHSSGICGTDIHVYHDRFRNYPPVILGHEFSGTVVETGEMVTRVKPSDRVCVLGSTAVTCGTCPACVQGFYMFCAVRRGMGHGVNGSFTRYVLVREDQAYRLPDHVSFEAGAVCEPFASAVQTVEELTSFHPGDVVLLSGPGPIGLLCLMLLVAHRCRVIVAGAPGDDLRLELARSLGAAVTVTAGTGELEEAVARETGGRGVDTAIEAAGARDSVVACLKSVAPLGAYVQVGIAGVDIEVPFDTVLYKQLRVYGSLGHSLKTWDRVMRIMEQGTVDIGRVVTHRLPLERWREAFDLCESRQAGKVLLYSRQERV